MSDIIFAEFDILMFLIFITASCLTTEIVGQIAEKYLLYLGTMSYPLTPCWCYLVPLRLVSTFLHVGRVQMLLQYFYKTIILSKKVK